MGGGVPSLNNASSEYLVDTENNKIILPYTTKENIIGLSEGPSIDVDTVMEKIDGISQLITELTEKIEGNTSSGFDVVIISNDISTSPSMAWQTLGTSGTNIFLKNRLSQPITEDMIGHWELLGIYCVSGYNDSATKPANFSADIYGCKLTINHVYGMNAGSIYTEYFVAKAMGPTSVKYHVPIIIPETWVGHYIEQYVQFPTVQPQVKIIHRDLEYRFMMRKIK